MNVITLCMGSSCFSRGNQKVLAKLQEHFRTRPGSGTAVQLRGCRCGKECCRGPNLWVDGELVSGATEETVLERLGLK